MLKLYSSLLSSLSFSLSVDYRFYCFSCKQTRHTSYEPYENHEILNLICVAQEWPLKYPTKPFLSLYWIFYFQNFGKVDRDIHVSFGGHRF